MTSGFTWQSQGPAGLVVPGSRLAGYLIEEQIGAGGMAVVFRARDEMLGRLAAVKVMAPALASDAEFRARFLRESRAVAAVDSPHIIPVYAAGEAGGVLYIATRFVPGGDLGHLLAQSGGTLAPALAVALTGQVAAALDAAHAAGLVHRDVKPGNILVESAPGRQPHAYLSDFGLSKNSLSASSGLSVTGQFLGTPLYSPPEQIRGESVDGRTDQYALACVAFVLLTGVPPFKRPDTIAIMFAQLNDPVPSVTALRPGLPAAVGGVLERALSKSSGDRYGTCGEFAAALRDALVQRGPATVTGWGATPGADDHARPGEVPPVPGTAAAMSRENDLGTVTVSRPGAGADPVTPPADGRQPPPPGTWQGSRTGWERDRPRYRWRIAAAAAVAAAGVLGVILVVPNLNHPGSSGGTTGGGTASSGGAPSGKASLRWSYLTGINLDSNQTGAGTASPAVVDGVVYAGGNNGDVYAFNAASGHLDWHYVTASAESGPTVADGTVYVGSAGGMYALNAANGNPRWSFGKGSPESTPVVVGSTVYVVGNDGTVYALDAANGDVRWSHSVSYAGTGLAVADGLVYVSTVSDIGYVYALDAATGHLRWAFKTLDARESAPTVVAGTVYVGCGSGPGSNGTVYAIDAANGQSRWSYPTGNGTPFGAGNGVESSPAVDGGTVYVGSDNGTVYALSTASGHLDWSYTTPTASSVVSSPAVDAGTVYVGSEDDRIYALSTASGHLVWSYPTGNLVVSNPAAAGGVVYVGSDDGKLYALATVK